MAYPIIPVAIIPPDVLPGWISPARGHYRIYRGIGSADAIDWARPAVLSPAGQDGAAIAGLGHVVGTTYYYAISAVSDAGVEQTEYDRIVAVEIDEAGELVAAPPNQLEWARAAPAAGGKVTVEFEYDAAGAAGLVSGVEFTACGPQGPDWAASLQTVAITGSCRRKITLTAVFSSGATVRLAARAVTAAGGTGPVTLLNPVVADSAAPDVVHGVTAEMV